MKTDKTTKPEKAPVKTSSRGKTPRPTPNADDRARDQAEAIARRIHPRLISAVPGTPPEESLGDD